MKTVSPRVIRFFPALLILGLWGGGCTKGKGNEGDGGDQAAACTDRACFSQCLRSEWSGLESYYVLSARCVDDRQCSCDARCDDALCDTYCRVEAGFLAGACAWVTCGCTDTVTPDSGEVDPDAGAPENDAGG